MRRRPFLRRSGADTGEVKRLFQNDLSGTIAKYDIIQNAKLYRDHIAIAVVDHTVGRVTAAQAADELLNIVGISTSFVLFPDGGADHHLRPLHGRHQRPGHPGAAGGAEATPPPPADRWRARRWNRWPWS